MEKQKDHGLYNDFFKNGKQEKKHRSLYKLKNGERIFYSEWKNGVQKYLSTFSNYEELINFKYFCFNRLRTQKLFFDIMLPIMLAVFPLALSPAFAGLFSNMLSNNILLIIIALLFIEIIFFCLIAFILYQCVKISTPKHFYEDIITIIEEFEKEKTYNSDDCQ